MKKLLSIVLLSGALALSGCGDSNTDFTQVSGQQGNPGPVVPTPTPTPTATAGYFVDAANGNDVTAAAAVNPTSDTPFATIAAAVADAPTNATITVRAGTYTGAVTLKDGQRLLGTAGGSRPVLGSTLTLANGNTVDFLEFRNITGRAIDANGVAAGTITNNVIDTTTGTDGIDGTGTGISLLDNSGTWTVTNNTITNADGISVAFRISGADSLRAYVNDNTITGNAGALVVLTQDTSQGLAQVHGNTMTGSGMEISINDASEFGLDLEDNITDGLYSLYLDAAFSTTNVFRVEQLTALTTAKPAGAGNTGTVDDNSGIGGKPLTDVPNGSLGL